MSCLARDPAPRFHRWSFTATEDAQAIVLPDGCTDILVMSQGPDTPETVRVTGRDTARRVVQIAAGTSITGYRLRPGTEVQLSECEIGRVDLTRLGVEIAGMTAQDQEITEIIEALSLPEIRVDGLARQQGVSERTLQRHFKTLSLPPPGFWRQLGRARRAAQALPCRVPLADIALEYGYSDQAHMTRAFMRWFGQTPAQLRQNPAALMDLAQPGLGNWLEAPAQPGS